MHIGRTQPVSNPEAGSRVHAGEWVFFVDQNDAVEALEARKQAQPGERVAIGMTSLGRAFGLTEGQAFGFSSNMTFPARMQGPKAVIEDLEHDGLDAGAKALCPPELRKQLNKRTSTIPMFSLNELVEGTNTAPYFFTKADMVRYWMAQTGKAQNELPPHLVMTDLRVLIIRMMSVPNDWKTLKLVGLSSTIEWLEAVAANQRAVATAAAAPTEALPQQQDEDTPPPLQQDEDAPPPLEGDAPKLLGGENGSPPELS